MLQIVSESPGISMGELSERMYLHISTSTGVIDRLEKKNLLLRKRSHADRRVIRLFITSKGRQTIRRIPMGMLGLLTREIEELRDSDIHVIWTGLNRLLKLLQLKKSHTDG
ncbi:hypothetical protein TRIP_C20146 [Candidatus Zixiibacteriota bacterium]|nr:hypothetical protein TRIP_C20146 [candidate division Zixibacteria bacterium]